MSNYYERYWSTAGFNPKSAIWPELSNLYAKYFAAGRWLDLGCGDGSVTAAWAMERASLYVGADIAQAALTEVTSRGAAATRIADVSALPFPNATFSMVSCIEVLERLFDRLAAVIEAPRVLVPRRHWRDNAKYRVLASAPGSGPPGSLEPHRRHALRAAAREGSLHPLLYDPFC